jgi:prolyl-tRNA synthetase
MSKQQQLAINVKKEENINEWYTEVIQKADLIEYTDVSGCIIFKPNSYQVWESIQAFFDERIKKSGVRNAYFPLFIPEKLLNKEENHIDGFSAEVAWVTKGGNSELKERLAIRPTSETIIGNAYSKWIRSYRDLPMRMNQWCNVVRWEFKHPTPFLRTREFLWQEGHCVFETKEEAEAEVLEILEYYRQVGEDLLAIPINTGRKSVGEKFAGAEFTTTIESYVAEAGRAIQGGTSHMLGQNFAKAFGIEYLDKTQKKQLPYQTSWGISTRLIGAMIMMHGDNKGLVLPPKVAYNKVVIVPLLFKGKEDIVLEKAEELKKILNLFNPIIDDDKKESPGFKFNKWEIQGNPIIIEVGPRDLEQGVITVNVRDLDEKITLKHDCEIEFEINKLLEEMQTRLLENSRKKIQEVTIEVKNLKDFQKAIDEGKRCLVPWSESVESEDEIKEKTGAKTSCLPFEFDKKSLIDVKCFYSGKPATCYAYFCKSF